MGPSDVRDPANIPRHLRIAAFYIGEPRQRAQGAIVSDLRDRQSAAFSTQQYGVQDSPSSSPSSVLLHGHHKYECSSVSVRISRRTTTHSDRNVRGRSFLLPSVDPSRCSDVLGMWKGRYLVGEPRVRPVCARGSCWHHPSREYVSFRPTTIFLSLNYPVAAAVSDFILVVAPLWILRDVRVSSGLRIRLIAIFSCSLMTTLVGLAHAILILKMPGALEAILGE